MNRPSRALPALAGGIALTIGGLAPAASAQWSHVDPAGDVVSYTYNYVDDIETGPHAEPENTTGDVTRVSVSHTARRVVLKTTLRDIAADSGLLIYEIRTGTRTYDVMQRLGTDRDFPAFDLSRNDRPVRCSGVRRSVDRTTEQATVSIPRSCLGRPSWVRVGAGVLDFEFAKDTERVFLDDGLQDGFTEDRLTLSPRVRRG